MIDYKLLLLVVLVGLITFFIYRELTTLKDEITDLKIELKKDIRLCTEKVRDISSENIEQLRKITLLNQQNVRKVDNYFTESENDIGTDFKYLSDIPNIRRHDNPNSCLYLSENKVSNSDQTSPNTEGAAISSPKHQSAEKIADSNARLSKNKDEKSNRSNKNFIEELIEHLSNDLNEYSSDSHTCSIIEPDNNTNDGPGTESINEPETQQGCNTYNDSELNNEPNNESDNESDEESDNESDDESDNEFMLERQILSIKKDININKNNSYNDIYDTITLTSTTKKKPTTSTNIQIQEDDSIDIINTISSDDIKNMNTLNSIDRYTLKALKSIAKHHNIQQTFKIANKWKPYDKPKLYEKIQDYLKDK